MSKTSSVCAIIPTYNRAALLRESIDSILAQTRPVQEIIVVNDGSTDDTENTIRSYGNRITLINKENGGKASALNLAFTQCTSDYIWLCDDDDVADQSGVGHLVAALDADDSISFAFGHFMFFRDEATGRSYSDPGYWKREEETNIKINFLEEMFTGLSAMLVRRSLYSETGPFREDLIRSQDYDMVLRLSRTAKARHIPQTIFFQRQHEGIRGTTTNFFPAEESRQKWLTYDKKIFAQIKQKYSLEEFIPTFALNWDNILSKRAALIQRGCIFARHAMWDDAISDFCRVNDFGITPITSQELYLVEAVISYPLSWTALRENLAWIRKLHECYRSGGNVHRIIFAACRPLLWQARDMVKNRDIRGGAQLLNILFGILGIRGGLTRGLLSFFN